MIMITPSSHYILTCSNALAIYGNIQLKTELHHIMPHIHRHTHIKTHGHVSVPKKDMWHTSMLFTGTTMSPFSTPHTDGTKILHGT